MYTAVYARVSTGMQAMEGTSLDGQVELCIKKAKEMHVYENDLKIYKEEGFSGEDIERPSMNLLRQDIASGLVNQIIITHPDRLSRDLTDKLFVCREFESRNVNLIFVDTEYKNTPEGQLFFNLISVIAQYELSLIKKRTVRGRLKAVEKDNKVMPMRVPPYGYNWTAGQLEINDHEAAFVKLIYQWYVYDHLTIREIGTKLIDLGATPKRAESKNWSASSIQKILKSDVYIGRFYYNRRKTQKIKGERTKKGAPKKTYGYRDEKDWILVTVPSIIDEHIFKLAQDQRSKNKKLSGNMKYEYLLKSLLRCGLCGRKWEATTYSGRVNKITGIREKYKCYRCPNINPRMYGPTVTSCPSRSIRAELVDEYVWGLIMETISDPHEYVKRIELKSESVVQELEKVAESIKKQLTLKEKEKEKIKIMFKRELINEQEMDSDFRIIKGEIEELMKQEKEYMSQIKSLNEKLTMDEKNNAILQSICSFIQHEGNELDFDGKRYVVETLISELLLRCEDSRIQVTAIGYLDELRSNVGFEKSTKIPIIIGELERNK
ncbi:recombinase family protein [Paenibacillus sp. KN14-4R]|uniref:recombinase family protein n=1 Tax=Paenibacillus sp. KN14-4R TaxID=3445773 RepID=UPI003F9EBDEF